MIVIMCTTLLDKALSGLLVVYPVMKYTSFQQNNSGVHVVIKTITSMSMIML